MTISFASKQYKELEERGFLPFCCAVLSAITISLYSWYFPPVMVIWCVVWIVGKNKGILKLLKNDVDYSVLLTLFIALYIWQIVGLLYSNNSKNGFENIFMRLPFLIIPFLLQNPGEMIKKNGRLLLHIFALGVVLYILICLIHALLQSLQYYNGAWIFKPYPENRYWNNYFFSSGGFTMRVHPSYFAMYTIMAIFIAFEAILNKSVNRISSWGWRIAVILMIISLYLLSSRAALLAIVVTVPIYFINRVKNNINFMVSFFGILMLFVVFFSVLNGNARFNYYSQKLRGSSLKEFLMLDERGNLWKSALKVIDKNILLGVGTGDLKEELLKEYNKNENVSRLKFSYNAHNEYLEMFLENGIIGLIIFLCILAWIFFISLKKKNILYTIFVLTCLTFFLFESMLSRLAGLSYFTVFSFLFFYIPVDKTLDISLS